MKNPKVIIITQARTGSTRLPGKILKQIEGKTLLGHHLDRLIQVKKAHDIVVATTTLPEDQVVIEICQNYRPPAWFNPMRMAAKMDPLIQGFMSQLQTTTGYPLSYFQGSPEDVLDRYYQTAQAFEADIIVRVTSDCPLIDPQIIDGLIETFLQNQNQYDYMANFYNQQRSFPLGFEVEVFSFGVLERAYHEASEKLDREHVTPYLWKNKDLFRLGVFHNQEDYSSMRLTVDTQADFELMQNLIPSLHHINHQFRLQDVIAVMKSQPEWQSLNQNIEHKYYS